jgi:hypothetical protein
LKNILSVKFSQQVFGLRIVDIHDPETDEVIAHTLDIGLDSPCNWRAIGVAGDGNAYFLEKKNGVPGDVAKEESRFRKKYSGVEMCFR